MPATTLILVGPKHQASSCLRFFVAKNVFAIPSGLATKNKNATSRIPLLKESLSREAIPQTVKHSAHFDTVGLAFEKNRTFPAARRKLRISRVTLDPLLPSLSSSHRVEHQIVFARSGRGLRVSALSSSRRCFLINFVFLFTTNLLPSFSRTIWNCLFLFFLSFRTRKLSLSLSLSLSLLKLLLSTRCHSRHPFGSHFDLTKMPRSLKWEPIQQIGHSTIRIEIIIVETFIDSEFISRVNRQIRVNYRYDRWQLPFVSGTLARRLRSYRGNPRRINKLINRTSANTNYSCLWKSTQWLPNNRYPGLLLRLHVLQKL